MPIDRAGNHLSRANKIGFLTGSINRRDWVGGSDRYDFYQFKVSNRSSFSLALSKLQTDANVELLNKTGRVIQSSLKKGTASEAIGTTLIAGTYYVKVYQKRGDTPYILKMSTNPVQGGPINLKPKPDLKGCFFGIGSASLTAGKDFSVGFQLQNIDVANADNFRVAFYVSKDSTITTSDRLLGYQDFSSLTAFSLSGDQFADLPLPVATDPFWTGSGTYHIGMIVDSLNQVAESNESNNSNLGNSINSQSINIKVGTSSGSPVNVTSAAYDPGNNLGAAYDLGSLNGLKAIGDSVNVSDSNDYYRFSLSTTQSVSLLLNGLSANANMQLLSSSGTVLASSTYGGSQVGANTDTTLEAFSRILNTGTYYIRIHPGTTGAITNYALSLKTLSPSLNFTDRVLGITNFFRTQSGLSALTTNAKLANAAYEHSQDMALNDFYAHTGSNGSNVRNRVNAAGYGGFFIGENIYLSPEDPETAMEGWMYSESHRNNIMNSEFQDFGVGYYYLANDTGNVNGNYYWTQNFGKSA